MKQKAISDGPDLVHFIKQAKVVKHSKFEKKPTWIKGEFPMGRSYENLKESVCSINKIGQKTKAFNCLPRSTLS